MNGKEALKGIRFDYVSGSLTGFFRLRNRDKDIEKQNFEDFVKLVDYTKGKLKGYFTWSTLFNAYQEIEDGRHVWENNKIGHMSVYSDSGGLQAVRRGMEINNDFKDKIYETQAKYSDYAMTFDEMPLKRIVANKTTKSIVSSAERCYIRELIEPAAKASAVHIQRQIDKFLELGTNCKILPILHGFRPEQRIVDRNDNTYVDYAEHLLGSLKNADEHVQGIAIASLTAHADNRVGILKVLDYIPRIFADKRIDDKYMSHVHLLGLASPQRILPILALAKQGLIDPRVKTISFDSTAITKAYTYGRVYMNYEEFKNTELRKTYSPELTKKSYKNPEAANVRQFYQMVHKHYKDYEGYMFDSWEDLAEHSQNNGSELPPSEQYKKHGKDYQIKYLQQVRITSMYHTFCYMDMLEKYIDNDLTSNDIVYYSDALLNIYHRIESSDSLETLQDHVEEEYAKLEVVVDHSVDTVAEFEEREKRITAKAEAGHDEIHTLFCDEGREKLKEQEINPQERIYKKNTHSVYDHEEVKNTTNILF